MESPSPATTKKPHIGLLGTAIGEGRGNIVIAAEYYDRRAAYERNRDFFRDGWADPSVVGNATFLQGLNGYNFSPPAGARIVPGVNPASNYYPAVSTLAAILGRSGTAGPTRGVVAYPGPTGGAAGAIGTVRFNPDATLFSPIGDNAASWRGPPIDWSRVRLPRCVQQRAVATARASRAARMVRKEFSS